MTEQQQPPALPFVFAGNASANLASEIQSTVM